MADYLARFGVLLLLIIICWPVVVAVLTVVATIAGCFFIFAIGLFLVYFLLTSRKKKPKDGPTPVP